MKWFKNEKKHSDHLEFQNYMKNGNFLTSDDLGPFILSYGNFPMKYLKKMDKLDILFRELCNSEKNIRLSDEMYVVKSNIENRKIPFTFKTKVSKEMKIVEVMEIIDNDDIAFFKISIAIILNKLNHGIAIQLFDGILLTKKSEDNSYKLLSSKKLSKRIMN